MCAEYEVFLLTRIPSAHKLQHSSIKTISMKPLPTFANLTPANHKAADLFVRLRKLFFLHKLAPEPAHILNGRDDVFAPFALIMNSLLIVANYRNACGKSSLFSSGLAFVSS